MKLLQLFDTLVPADAGEVKDLLGSAYPIPVAVSARKAIAASRLLRKVMEATISESSAGNKLELGTALNWSAGIVGDNPLTAVATTIACSGESEGLGALFEAAYPEVLDAARGKAADKTLGALDLFDLDAIVTGILPLFGRLGRPMARVHGALQDVGAPAEKTGT